MRNRPPNLSTVGGVDRQTDISNERLRTISCIGVKQIPQKYRRLVMGSLGSHKERTCTCNPAFQQTNTLLANNDGMAPQSDQPQRKFLPQGGLTPSNIHQIGEHSPKTTRPNINKPSAQPTQPQTIEPNYQNRR